MLDKGLRARRVIWKRGGFDVSGEPDLIGYCSAMCLLLPRLTRKLWRRSRASRDPILQAMKSLIVKKQGSREASKAAYADTMSGP